MKRNDKMTTGRLRVTGGVFREVIRGGVRDDKTTTASDRDANSWEGVHRTTDAGHADDGRITIAKR